MAELEPCRVCGVVPEEERRYSHKGAVLWFVRHDCVSPLRYDRDEAAAEWNAANDTRPECMFCGERRPDAMVDGVMQCLGCGALGGNQFEEDDHG